MMMRVLSRIRVVALKMRLTLMRASVTQISRFGNLQMTFSSLAVVVESQLLIHKVTASIKVYQA